MTKVDSLVNEALALPADEREELARRIAATVEADPDHEQAWDREIARRLDRIDRGEVEVLDMEEFDQLAWGTFRLNLDPIANASWGDTGRAR